MAVGHHPLQAMLRVALNKGVNLDLVQVRPSGQRHVRHCEWHLSSLVVCVAPAWPQRPAVCIALRSAAQRGASHRCLLCGLARILAGVSCGMRPIPGRAARREPLSTACSAASSVSPLAQALCAQTAGIAQHRVSAAAGPFLRLRA